MPGFGQSPFGQFPFGEWAWSDTMLFQYVPELYRQADAGDIGDGALRAFLDSVRPSFDVLRRYIRAYGDLRDPLKVASQYDGQATLRLGKQIELLGEVEQFGIDGVITPSRAFTAPTARFRPADRGKRLTVKGSAVAGNNTTFLIGAVVDAQTVILDPLAAVDPGPVRWQVRAPLAGESDTVVVEVQSGDVGVLNLGWVLYDGSAEYPVRGRQRFQRPTTERRFLTELEGSDGFIDTQGNFISAAAVFDRRHVGQILSLDGSATLNNKGYVRIYRIVGTSAPQTVYVADVSTGLPILLTPEAEPFHWALYPRSLVTVRSIGAPTGVVEQEGYDLNVLTSVGANITFEVPSATLDPVRDLGKYLRVVTLTGNNQNNRLLRISAITSPTQGSATIVSPAYPGTGSLALESNMFWELRAGTGQGDQVEVTAHPVSILQYLATDFGIQIDSQESEDIQRSWVANVTSWLDLKGSAKSYEIIGLVSGFTITAEQLYRVSLDLAPTVPDLYEVELRESEVGRAGLDGVFTPVAGTVEFSSVTAAFRAGDEGRLLRIQNAAVSGNNRYYTIDAVLDATTVRVRSVDEPTLPDANNGSLYWNLSRLYTTLPPLLPRYDEINSDALAYYYATNPPPGDFFAADTFCWEPNFSTSVPIVITSVLNVVPSREWTIFFTGPGEVVADTGSWYFEVAGVQYYLESVPIEGPPLTWAANIKTVTAPPTGAGVLGYQCRAQLLCEYCGAAKILATITTGLAVTLTPQMLERYRERILRRLTEVTPAHVDLIPRFRTDIDCVFGPNANGLEVTLEAGLVSASMIVPFTALYDDIPADIYGAPAFDGVTFYYTDLAILVTVETP